MSVIALSLGLILTAYLLGSIPWGLVLTRWAAAEDIRSRGKRQYRCHQCGASGRKIHRCADTGAGYAEGGLPVYSALLFIDHTSFAWGDTLVAVVALSSFFGHLFPVFLKFKTGGKGLPSLWGVFWPSLRAPVAVRWQFFV